MQVSVIGLGKLGLPLAAVLAEAGNQVFAYDTNELLREEIRNGSFSSNEPKLVELLSEFGGNIEVLDSVDQVVLRSELTFIIVPTPSLNDGSFNNELVLSVLEKISDVLKIKKEFHVIDVVSTVMPGSCQEEFIPLLVQRSGRILNKHFGLCYNPEFIALGSVIKNMKEPDMHLIGASGFKSGKVLERALKSVTGDKVPSRVMNLTEAELVKISVNNFVTTKISFANMLMQVADKLGGVDVDVVTEAIGLDSRIGRKYLKGGTSFGGPCFPRDTYALSTLLSKLDLNPALPDATSRINREQNEFLLNKVLFHLGSQNRVGFIGFSYKPDTGVYEESTGLRLGQALVRIGKTVHIWEPLVDTKQLNSVGHFSFVDDLEGLSECETIIITREITQDEAQLISHILCSGLVIDPWGHKFFEDSESFRPGVRYVPLGRS